MSLVLEEEPVSCLVCGKPAGKDGLCALHHLAKAKLNQSYKLWDIAYGGLSYVDYLRLLVALPETGETVAAIARLVLQDKGEGNVKDASCM